jgi:nucleoside-diphosphate-sugar epimerase
MDLEGATVAVTGATGFIGRYLVDGLVRRGADVVAVVRRPERAQDLGVTVRRADLAEPQALRQAFEGAQAVVSNAALVSLGAHGREQLVATNVTGTENVLRAAADAGASHVVQISSATVYRPKRDHFYAEDDPLLDESDFGPRLLSGPTGHYAVSKACAERAAWRLSDELGLTLSTLRPHTVFGAHDRQTFTRWLRRFMRLPVSVFPTHLYLPPIYAGDLATAVACILERADRGQAYNAAHPPDVHSYWDLMEAYRAAGGRSPRLVLPIPVPIRRRYTTDRLRALGWQPRPLVQSFRDMITREATR